ncbi:MAG TPA: choice-of-anchor B family protein [Steroidobacteraceae bacterium]|nr:choice-of-anchor B family protein [Steroidobacteraceae bacterium]
MRRHVSSSIFLLLAALLPAALVQGHDDVIGTRFVAPEGEDVGDCDDNHEPCRTLHYALSKVGPGDAIKLAAGTYDLAGVDLERLAVGKEGVRGGYSAEDHFRIQNAESNPTRVTGVPDELRNNFIAHGFIVLDANGNALPRIEMAKLLAPTACTGGRAGSFPCHNIDFLAQVQLGEIPTQPTSASNLWGFVDVDDNREYAVLGHRNGTAVYDVTAPANPVLVGNVPGTPSLWREVKVDQRPNPAGGPHQAYAYASTEGPGGGLQIIDLSNLPNSIPPAQTLLDYSTSHTLYVSNIDYATNMALPGQQAFLYIAGANIANGAFRIYDLSNPAVPVLVTPSPPGTGYMHDSTSMLITDNRTTQCANAHNPCEVLVDFNETSVDLWDVTEKSAPVRLSTTTYPTATYVHSGWPSQDQRYIIVHDELDELRRSLNTHIYTLDVGDLRAPSLVTSYLGGTTSTDHNGYTIGNRYYVAHYKRGLVIFDSTNPNTLSEIGSFDTYLSPAANSAGTDGVWGVYPFLPSGTLLVSDIENGLFLLKKNETLPPPPPVQNPPPTPTPARGGGGGGSLDLVALILLAGFAMLRGLLVQRKSNGLPARRFAIQVDALQPRGRQRRAPAGDFPRPVA